jgi:hypothetical protein
MNVMSQSYSGTEDETRSNSQENQATDVLFSRYRRVLYRVAYRVLENHKFWLISAPPQREQCIFGLLLFPRRGVAPL